MRYVGLESVTAQRVASGKSGLSRSLAKGDLNLILVMHNIIARTASGRQIEIVGE